MGVNPQDDFFVALPDEEFKFGPPQCVDIRVPSTGASARVVVGDVGPWNGGHTYSGASLNDPYWSAGGVFTDGGFHPPQTSSGTDLRHRPLNANENGVGIDISYQLQLALGLKGNTQVAWRFAACTAN